MWCKDITEKNSNGKNSKLKNGGVMSVLRCIISVCSFTISSFNMEFTANIEVKVFMQTDDDAAPVIIQLFLEKQ